MTDLKVVSKRRFAFVGYQNEHEAEQVKHWFDGSFWGGVKIKVDYVTEDVRRAAGAGDRDDWLI